MPDHPVDSLPAHMAHTAPFARALRALSRGRSRRKETPLLRIENAVSTSHAALISVCCGGGVSERVWIVCESPRAQEKIFACLQQWIESVLFLPDSPTPPAEGALPDPATVAERLRVLEAVSRPASRRECVLLTRRSLLETIPNPRSIQKQSLTLQVGRTLAREAILQTLEKAGYELVPRVSERGQIAVRGGILDLFSFQEARPIRIEFFGDEIESIRGFDLDAQTSYQQLSECTVLFSAEGSEETCPLTSLVSPGDLFVYSDAYQQYTQEKTFSPPESPCETTAWILQGWAPDSPGKPGNDSTACYETGLGDFAAGDFVLHAGKRERFFQQLEEWRDKNWKVFLFCQNEGETERLRELIPSNLTDFITWRQELMPGGFVCPAAETAALSAAELLGFSSQTPRLRRGVLHETLQRGPVDFTDLGEGELVVHLEHGIARFEGLREMPRGEGTEQVLTLSFAHGARVYVPLEQSGMVSRYVGLGRKNPPLSELGDGKWNRARKNAEKAIFDYAGRLLRLHAERETESGYAFSPDTHWVEEFERAFPYTETPDQLKAIADTKRDMESKRPMDRLICGDVGFGKTEVALRAAFKAVMGGKQVAMLVPTTVLAEQHFRNFRERVSAFPVRVEMLSRFRSPQQQRETLEGLRNGSIDIVIGTHRLLSQTVGFRDLGLVIIDEEQRFGVLHKERLRERFRLIDQLTLSATPIPRTLYMSLMGAKDMSTLETPPANRIPVETFICPYDERIIRDAIQRELEREGQVYFLHNRIESIERVRQRIQTLVPKARILVGHGQMNEEELEEVMHRFVSGDADVLVSTTIIESGLDIPNANTILIDRADRFGLADLYQLRGRVGRSDHKAYAYLLLPRALMTVGEARKRINAIKQYSSLGAGFKIALRDLEIRGAGNILGVQQSGHAMAIGFDLYCTLLKDAIARQRGEALPNAPDCVLRLDFVVTREADFTPSGEDALAPAYLPLAFIEEPQARISAYRDLTTVRTEPELDALFEVWKDRFGKRIPAAVQNLLCLHRIRIASSAQKVAVLEVKEGKVMIQRRGDYVLVGNRFPRLNPRLNPPQKLDELLALIRAL
jgi:transcription-repair coupling factor (superfamily II helicase)